MNYLLVFIFIAIGAFLYWNAIVALINAMRSRSWPATPATINNVELEKDFEGVLTVKVGYTYTADGVEHDGKLLSFGYTGSDNVSNHKKIFEKLNKSKIVEVHYNPDNSVESCLAVGITMSDWINISIVMIWTGFSVGLFGLWSTNTLHATSLILILTGFICSFIAFGLDDFLLLRKLKIIA